MEKLLWTFTKGNADNPLYLKEKKPVFINKSITFPTNQTKKLVRIGIRADIIEYDFGPNDNFLDDSISLKVNEIDSDKLYSITCRHEASEIVFGFRILPLYS